MADGSILPISYIEYSEETINGIGDVYENQYIELAVEVVDKDDVQGEDYVDEDGNESIIYKSYVYKPYSTFKVMEIDHQNKIAKLRVGGSYRTVEVTSAQLKGAVILPRYRAANYYRDRERGGWFVLRMGTEDISMSLSNMNPSYQIEKYREKAGYQIWMIVDKLKHIFDLEYKPGQTFAIKIPVNLEGILETEKVIRSIIDFGYGIIVKSVPPKAMVKATLLHVYLKDNVLILTIDFKLKQDYDVVGIPLIEFDWY